MTLVQPRSLMGGDRELKELFQSSLFLDLVGFKEFFISHN